MESPQSISPNPPFGSAPSSRSRSSTKLDDVTSLTSFNPFSEEDENDQSSYALVSSLLSKVRNTLAAPLTAATAAAALTVNPSPAPNAIAAARGPPSEPRRPSIHSTSNQSVKSSAERPGPLHVNQVIPAPPLVSLTPVTSESPSLVEMERSASQGGSFYSPEAGESWGYGTYIPGFPIQDSDARSIRTNTSNGMRRSGSVSKVIRRIRGEGLSRDYWMDDALCKECYDCKSVFTAWRRKHHCRICGQIYCSRCASNIIKGSRFGHDGMVRVCNLCLDKLAKVDDDDDDSRSVISSATSPFAAHQLGAESRSFNHLAHVTYLPQSPFAASQLFGRNDSFSLFSIAETKRPRSGSEGSGFGSRPLTPGDDIRVDGDLRSNLAPFRRPMLEEEKDPSSLSAPSSQDHSPVAHGSKTPIDFPVTVPVSLEGSTGDGSTSSVTFPITSPEQLAGSDGPNGIRSRYNSLADLHGVAGIRSRVQSRLAEFDLGEPGWRTRRESTAYAQELNTISMFHLRIMLRQMLTTENIPNVKEWEETLLRLALRIARELTFTAHPHREGADMDVRRYVKIKKVPGGAPSDSEYVDGAVITKNVAHKSMLRTQRNPRVMLVTFPLEFHRIEGQYVHFGQILMQEKDYLGNLASRIAALRPHVVLVEKSVSRLALEALAKRNIAVARTVKPSAIHFVARMTQGDVFSSIDKLALEPRLGHCTKFRVQTFDHPLIPGRRKTYMRFEGCSREMGCTIILRGGDIDVLKRVKRVTRFLAFAVRNLRLETHLWKDSVITLPALSRTATPSSLISLSRAVGTINVFSSPSAQILLSTTSRDTPGRISIFTEGEDLLGEEAEQKRLSRRIEESLEPYEKTFISVSATLRFPPPYPIRRMKELDDELVRVKREWEDDLVRREEKSTFTHQQEETVTEVATPVVAVPSSINTDDLAAQIESLPIPQLPGTPTPGATTPSEQSGYFDIGHNLSSSSLLTPAFVTSPAMRTPSEESPIQPKTMDDIALESRLSYVQWQHAEQCRIWEWYLRKNKDDFDAEKYQCISLWEFTLPIAEYGLHRACFPPQLNYITFYGDNDCTLGQFIEKSVRDTLVKFLDPKAVCEGKGCGQPISRHCKVYVHHETRLFVAVEQWDGQITDYSSGFYAPASAETIVTWSACRLCGSATPFIPVSEEMQRYSFAKFLELHFYPADVQLVQGAGCQHNIYKDHIRYFAYQGMTVRFQADPVVLHEIVYPPMRIRVRPETQLEIKNRDFERLHHRNHVWYSGLIDDLKLINIDAATGDEATDAILTAHINTLILRAEWEKDDVARYINKIYSDSPPTDTLALNQLRAKRQDLIVAWQLDFDRLPKPRITQLADRNGRRMSSAFGTVRAMWPRRFDFEYPYTASANISEAEDYSMPTMRRVTGDSFASASEASETESTGGPEQELAPPPETQPGSFVEKQGIAGPTGISPKSDPGSDSTVAAPYGEEQSTIPARTKEISLDSEQEDAETARPSKLQSRLPRRAAHPPSVAELVKRYQEYLPPLGVEELAKTAMSPAVPVSEGEQDAAAIPYPRTRMRSKTRQLLSKRPSMSDFEQSYAANIAPKYLTHARRAVGQPSIPSRIPGPAMMTESRQMSRRPSPDKRPSMSKMHTDISMRAGRSSPPPSGRLQPSGAFGTKGRGKSVTRPATKEDKARAPRQATVRRPTGTGSKVSNIAKHFERITRDNERANRRYAVIRGRRARPVATARAKVEILDSITDAIKDEEESDGSDSSEADDEGGDEDENDARRNKEPKILTESPQAMESSTEAESECQTEGELEPATLVAVPKDDQLQRPHSPTGSQPSLSIPPSPALPPIPSVAASPPVELELGGTGSERISILKTLAGFWPQQPQPSRLADMDDPMADPEHIFRDSSMVVRTDEPTSIIALALNSPQYRDMLAKSRAEKRQAREPKLTDGGEAFMPDDKSVAESTSTWGVVNVDSIDGADPTEELRVPSSKLPWAISFESGGLTISCTVLFAEQFDALRRTYDCERSMIESLARCVKWDASGGKSGSAFLKTLDDRFIAKELSRAELQAMETFAPAYFDYMSSAVVAHRPTLLAKIFGCYKISFRKTHKDRGSKSKPTQMNLLVMENLFYDRRFSKIYDLKGSTRNRHVQSTGRENEVLLDENLVETAHMAPFYLREHSKRILRGALYNDSKFLADINVMDYSLVVGVDSVRNELVVGIVDYIRTYTWDKKLESWVKDSAFLGGANKGEPTIIGPRQYRQRFLSAMERYFPLVPDRWMKQHDAPEEEGNNLLDLWPDW